MIRLFLAEDHNIVRNGIGSLLETEEDFLIVGEAENGRQALDKIANGLIVDIVLTDINMPELDGIALLKEVKKLNSTIRIILLSMHGGENYISQAFLDGANGYLLKTVTSEELIFAIKHINAGYQYISTELSINILFKQLRNGNIPFFNENSDIEFSARELEILYLITEGFTNNEISAKLFISKRTVEGHRQSLINKTGAKNTATLVKFAILNGIFK